ncbi:MAG: hypothetical protein P0S95_05275 [Rhabdochlamydiaceae bacterium]|nr:hypothetical protein [Candidatus Amphrikana amoebophyrae]
MLKPYIQGLPPYADRFLTWGAAATLLSISNSRFSHLLIPTCAKRLDPWQLGVVVGAFSAVQFIFKLFACDHPVSRLFNSSIVEHLVHIPSAYPVAELVSSYFFGVFLIKSPIVRYSMITFGILNQTLGTLITIERAKTAINWHSFKHTNPLESEKYDPIRPESLKQTLRENPHALNCAPYTFTREGKDFHIVLELIPQNDGSQKPDLFKIHISLDSFKKLKQFHNGLEAFKDCLIRYYNQTAKAEMLDKTNLIFQHHAEAHCLPDPDTHSL